MEGRAKGRAGVRNVLADAEITAENVDRGERVRVIQRVRDALSGMSRDDKDPVLRTFDVVPTPEDAWASGPSRTGYRHGALTVPTSPFGRTDAQTHPKYQEPL
jgi:hypothetical protein